MYHFGGLLFWLSGVKLLFVALHPVALALYVNDPAMVKQAVQDGCGDDRVAEELLPLREALVRGDYSAGPFVPVGDELKD